MTCTNGAAALVDCPPPYFSHLYGEVELVVDHHPRQHVKARFTDLDPRTALPPLFSRVPARPRHDSVAKLATASSTDQVDPFVPNAAASLPISAFSYLYPSPIKR